MNNAHVWPEEMGLEDGEPILQPLEATRKVTRAMVDQLRCAATANRVTLRRTVLRKHFDSADPFALPECEFHQAMEVIRNGG